MLNKIFGAVGISVSSVLVSASLSLAYPLGPFPSESISGHRSSPPYGWDYNYDIEFTADELLKIHVEIDFNLINGVTQTRLNELKPIWEKGIEDTWNNKYAILKDDTYLFPIAFDVTFDGPVFNYNVNVRPGPERSDMTNWDTEDTGLVAAHEFGHMLGLFDEYEGGATDPINKIVDPTSIMGSTAPGSQPKARHYEDFRAWLAAKDTTETFVLTQATQVPEPGTAISLTLGFTGLVITRVCRRQAKVA
jgi:hypothetical protein